MNNPQFGLKVLLACRKRLYGFDKTEDDKLSKIQKLRNAISDFIVAQCDFSANELGFADVVVHRCFIERLTKISETIEKQEKAGKPKFKTDFDRVRKEQCPICKSKLPEICKQCCRILAIEALKEARKEVSK